MNKSQESAGVIKKLGQNSGKTQTSIVIRNQINFTNNGSIATVNDSHDPSQVKSSNQQFAKSGKTNGHTRKTSQTNGSMVQQ